MIKVGTVLALLVAFQAFGLTTATRPLDGAEPEADWTAPWFCHDLDCPKYKVLKTTEDYELRRYQKAKWASTTVETAWLEKGLTVGFKRLFDYISGENESKQKIAMTAPVRTLIHAGQGPECNSSFTVSFMVPFDMQRDTPKPTNPDIFLETSPKLEVYVSSFGGFALHSTVVRKAKELLEKLTVEGIVADTDDFYSAGYDSPFRLIHRHNEVWIKAKDSDVSNDLGLAVDTQ